MEWKITREWIVEAEDYKEALMKARSFKTSKSSHCNLLIPTVNRAQTNMKEIIKQHAK